MDVTADMGPLTVILMLLLRGLVKDVVGMMLGVVVTDVVGAVEALMLGSVPLSTQMASPEAGDDW